MSLRLVTFDDDQWAERVTQRWFAFIEEHPASRLCLPTGETPRPVYARSARVIDFSNTTVFLLDEFDLPPGDPARCDEMIHRDFLDLLPRPPARVQRLDFATASLAEECRRIEDLIDDGGLDLTILGLGTNGHLGLNEPGSLPDSPTRVIEVAPSTAAGAHRYGTVELPTRGMTIGLRPILDSKEIWLLVTGSGKAGILERVMNGPIAPDVPASFLRDHPNVVVFADRAANSGLAG
ncbi:MAG: glucosamine-6-phosphate deaminase [Actinomycetota bacterium]|nr:glucosamine-6-phosphate deaminase [Actinomycetota bacterium]